MSCGLICVQTPRKAQDLPCAASLAVHLWFDLSFQHGVDWFKPHTFLQLLNFVLHCPSLPVNVFCMPHWGVFVMCPSHRKVIGHTCSIVPLKSHWCAFHFVQRYIHTPPSRSSQLRTRRTSHTLSLRAKRCTTLLCNTWHIVLCVKIFLRTCKPCKNGRISRSTGNESLILHHCK